MASPNMYVNFPIRTEGYSFLSYDIIPYTQANQYIYWAFQYYIKGTASGGYVGLQTRGHNQLPVPEAPAINFSQWDVGTGQHGYIEPYMSGPFGGEGEGWQCHCAYPWVPGKRYRIQLRIGEDNNKIMASINGQGIGAMPMPSDATGLFDQGAVIWGEEYGGHASTMPARCLVKNFYAGHDYGDKRDCLVASHLFQPGGAGSMDGAGTVTPKDGGYELLYYAFA